ncbi:hypothetical protein Tco_1094454 [Tanacetum coccineum]|uniref:Uncharacterized protein n=1 Tax=Tanacetum coccineum TaxID=301880 RepID=A0ABQ5IGW3_9ASTR
MSNVLNRFPLVFKDRLLTLFNEEVGGDVVVIREYRGISCGLRFVLGVKEEYESDRCNHTLALMGEVEAKAREKSRFILKLSGYEVPQFILRCHREISDDVRLGVCAVKMAELMKQIQDKDIQNLMKLQILGTEFEILVFYLLIDMENIGTHCDVVMSKVLVEPCDMQLFVVIWAAAEDRGFAMRMNLMRKEIADVYEYRRNLVDELCTVRNVIAPIKAAEDLTIPIRSYDYDLAKPKTILSKRGRDTKIPQSGGPPIKVGDEAVHKELGDRMERAATTASSFEAEQDSGSGPRCQETTLGM